MGIAFNFVDVKVESLLSNNQKDAKFEGVLVAKPDCGRFAAQLLPSK